MFTGIIEEVGRVTAVRSLEEGREITIGASLVLEDLKVGDSVNVDGACQTVVSRGRESFSVQAIRATLSRTTLGEFEPGRPVNLERALAAGGRFGGHWVQGHVDGVGTVRELRRAGETVFLRVELPEPVRPVTVPQGSLAINGVSLTVHALPAEGEAEVALIPYTYEHTNLSRLKPGDRVNVEADLVGKYVVRYLARLLGLADPAEAWREIAARLQAPGT
ncbi:MAG: riboflavin synthase [Gemmatimonadetes bacterium]|nr:riboflavin synthase [Gemmatimonadota bacterium]